MATAGPITLIDAREDANLSQSELAAEAGVPRGTIYNWESKRCFPADGEQFHAVAKALGVSPKRLYV